MSAEIIVPLNVGGTVFQTSSLTMLKTWNMYPNSKFARFYNEHEGQSRKFFLDEDAEYFWIVLNFLRNGEVFPFDEEIFSVSAIWQKTSNSPNLSNSLRLERQQWPEIFWQESLNRIWPSSFIESKVLKILCQTIFSRLAKKVMY